MLITEPYATLDRSVPDDDSLLRWMLGLTPAQRLEVLQGFVGSVSELRNAETTPLP